MIKVKIYSTMTCPFCKMEKDYLDAKGIEYENVYVEEDDNVAKELMGMSGQFGVPFTVFTKEDGTRETLLGYDKEAINKKLNIN